MTANKKTRTGRLFYCTGYGDCKMVFTRGEHLARHIRKHTGEKPFQCIVPECNKTFSRFDNMMQHTQTHRRRELYNNNSSSFNNHNHSHTSTSTIMDRLYHKDSSLSPSNNNHSNPYSHPCPRQQEQEYHDKIVLMEPNQISLGLTSPISLTSSSIDSSDDDEELDEPKENSPHPQHNDHWVYHRRRLSIADLCHPIDQSPLDQKEQQQQHLSFDEIEALLAFGKLKQQL